jgi:hypothetical protein
MNQIFLSFRYHLNYQYHFFINYLPCHSYSFLLSLLLHCLNYFNFHHFLFGHLDVNLYLFLVIYQVNHKQKHHLFHFFYFQSQLDYFDNQKQYEMLKQMVILIHIHIIGYSNELLPLSNNDFSINQYCANNKIKE